MEFSGVFVKGRQCHAPASAADWNSNAAWMFTIFGARMTYPKRLPSLDGLRGVAALIVMLYHFNLVYLPQAQLYNVFPLLRRAYLAVDLFFLLSGFVMAHVYGGALASNWRAHWRHFAIARFARIYPLFALTTLAMVIIFAFSRVPLDSISFSAPALALQPLLLQHWHSSLSWDYPSWSISTEAEAYVFFVFCAGALFIGKYPRLMAACCVAILAALSSTKSGSLDFNHGFAALVRTLAEFSLGALLYRIPSGNSRPRNWAAILSVLLMGLAIATYWDLLVVGGFASLIYYGVNADDAFGRFLNSRALVALANWSYSIYLWHAPVHYAAMSSLGRTGYAVDQLSMSNARLLLLVTAAVVVGLSAISHRYFETPARRGLMRLAPAR